MSSEDLLRVLADGRDAHLNAGAAVAAADEGRLFGVDLLALAALHRSVELGEGFAILTRAGNATAAIPLLRLQVDTVLRLWACWLVDRPHDLALKLLDDVPLARCGMKTRDGQQLHDKLLYQTAQVEFPWIEEVYRTTSGVVHLSQPAFAQSSLDATGHEVRLGVGHRRNWTEEEKIEAIDAFIAATQALLRLVVGYVAAKESAAANADSG